MSPPYAVLLFLTWAVVRFSSRVDGSFLREVKAIIEPVWFECSELQYPKILSSKEGLPYLVFRHVSLRYFLNNYQLEIPIKIMIGLQEVPVYPD